MHIDGWQALIIFESEINMFRGEFIGVNGDIEFYANDVKGLHSEGAISLRIFLERCTDNGIEARKIS
ncbi:hypothetical protein [Glaciimonas sp. GG7]